MNWEKITKIAVIAVIVATIILVVLDIFAFLAPEPCNTISCAMLGWSREHPVIVFLGGLLCGHLFLPQKILIMSDGKEVYRD